jgi:hypothetical protein
LGKYHNRVYKKKNSTLSSFSQLLFVLILFFGGGGGGTWGLLNFLGGNFWGAITLRARIGVFARAGRVLRDSAQ